jgi:hypothetical protein
MFAMANGMAAGSFFERALRTDAGREAPSKSRCLEARPPLERRSKSRCLAARLFAAQRETPNRERPAAGCFALVFAWKNQRATGAQKAPEPPLAGALRTTARRSFYMLGWASALALAFMFAVERQK